MSAILLDQEAQRRIVALEVRNAELERHITLLNQENDMLRDEARDLRAEAAALRVQMLNKGDE